jgi:hypothetical protein
MSAKRVGPPCTSGDMRRSCCRRHGRRPGLIPDALPCLRRQVRRGTFAAGRAKLGGDEFGFAGSSTASALPLAATLIAAGTFAIAAAAAPTTVTVDVRPAAAGRGGVSSLEVPRGTLVGDSSLDAVAGG